jgi:hypothetical protein
MADRLSIMNVALGEVEQTTLGSLTDPRGGEALRLLNRNWDRCVASMLEAGGWNFALRTIRIEPDPDVTTSFGYQYAFTKPDDWVRTQNVAMDEYLRQSIRAYKDQIGWWFCDITPIYVHYVSSGDSYGMNIGAWTQSFADALAYKLAMAIAPKVTTSENIRDRITKTAKKSLLDALSLDAANQPSDPMPNSSWVRSRNRWGNRGRSGPDGSSWGL